MNPERRIEFGGDIEDMEITGFQEYKEVETKRVEVIEADEGLPPEAQEATTTVSIESAEFTKVQIAQEQNAQEIAKLAMEKRQSEMLDELERLLAELRESHGVDIKGVKGAIETKGDISQADEVLKEMVDKLRLQSARLHPTQDTEKAESIVRIFRLTQEIREGFGKPEEGIGERRISKVQEIPSNI